MDLSLAELINHLGRGSILDRISEVISWLPFLAMVWLIFGLYVYLKDRRNMNRVFWAAGVAVLIHFIFTDGLIKDYLADAWSWFRIRPWLAHPDTILPIGKVYNDSSLPSGHLSSTVAILTVFVWHYPRVWSWAVIFTLILTFSRIHNGMHYPTDTLVGAALGILYGLAAVKIVNWVYVIRHKI